MTEKSNKPYVNPEIAGVLSPKLDAVLPSDGSLKRTVQIKNAINSTSNELGMHPQAVLANLRVSQAETTEEAVNIDKERIHRYAYIGDIHGFTEEKQAELSETLLSGNFTEIFFIGDIGGSTQMAKLQQLFYQGSTVSGEDLLWNKYHKELEKEGVDDKRVLDELKPGFININAYERTLEDSSLSEADAREKAMALTDEEILDGIKRIVAHQHYGHYLSDLPEAAINTLANDAKANYLRFVSFVKGIEQKTGATSYVLEGNWDARLPYDFERGTATAVALPVEKRRLLAGKLLRDNGINFVSEIATIENADSMHVLLPFDPLMQDLDEQSIAKLQQQVELARKNDKQVRLVAHGVPSWEMHGNMSPTGEGKVTAKNLLTLVGALDPDEIVYGHEHFLRKDKAGQFISSDSKYRIVLRNGIAQAEEIDGTNGGTIASPVPMSNELIKVEGSQGSLIGVSETLLDKSHNHNVIRGRGGKASPVRVNRPIAKFTK